LKSYSALALVWVLPTAFFLNAIEALGYVFTGRFRRGGALVSGWLGAFAHPGELRRARAAVQRTRRVDDSVVRDLMVRGSARLRTLTTQRLHAGDRLMDVSERTRAAMLHARGRLQRLHVVAAVTLAVVIVFGSRLLVFDRVPEVATLRAWPGAGALWKTFFTPWRYTMMGSSSASPPAFGLMGTLSTLFLGDSDLARTFVVAGALPLGAWGAYRLSRPLSTSSSAPSVVAAIAYAVNPVARNAIADGQLGPMVLFALAPWMMSALVRATGDEADRRARTHAVLVVALLGLVATAMWPPAIVFPLVVASAFGLAAPLVGGARIAGRTAAMAVIGAVGAFVLCAPWSLTWFGADGGTFALLPRRAPSLEDVLAFHTGAAGTGVASLGFLVAATLPLAVARGPRLAWAARAWVLAAMSFALAWLPGRLDASVTPALEGVLVPAALGLALAIGLGAAAFLDELRTFHFGWRQLAPLAAIVGLTLPALGMAVDTWQGSWRLPGDDWPARMSWMNDDPTPGGFRLLWVGDPEVLPADAKVVDGVGFALTRDGTGDARALWAAPEDDADRVVAEAIARARDGRTDRLGHILAPAGVRYIAFVDRSAPGGGETGRRDARLAAALDQQLDLGVSRVESGATLYENESWAPRRATVAAGTTVPTGVGDPIVAAQRTDLSSVRPVKSTTRAGTLLWSEASHAGWHARVDGKDAPRSAAFGWTNAYAVRDGGRVEFSFEEGSRRVLQWIELLVWIAAIVGWGLTRKARTEEA
jgi:hypothetical protein